MNPSFLLLPQEKQNFIMNAGFKVFAMNTYKKAPMSEIADAAGISKALLFYYFKNKQELYLYLWKNAMQILSESIANSDTLQTTDFFEMLKRSAIVKCRMMKEYPYLSEFQMRAYYEADENVMQGIQTEFERVSAATKQYMLSHTDVTKLRDGLNPEYIYQEVMWASDGFLRPYYFQTNINCEQLEEQYLELIAFWKKTYERDGNK